MDPGETELFTAFRETQEEAGLKKEDLQVHEDFKKVLQYNVNGFPKIVYYWPAELINPNTKVILSNEHQAYKWLELKEACELAGYKDMQKTLEDFDNYINSLI